MFFRNNELVQTCKTFKLADDVTIGVVVNMILKVSPTESYLFHSINENAPPDSHKKDEEELKNQVRINHCFLKIYITLDGLVGVV